MASFLDFAKQYVVVGETKCYRHCEQPAKLSAVRETDDSYVGAYVCPGNYVSRVVYVAEHPDEKWFKDYLSENIGTSRVRDKDIRVATRYGWELGQGAEERIHDVSPDGIKQYYWVFYPKDESDKKEGTFQCSSCERLYTRRIDSKEKSLCPDCSRKS